MITVMEKMLTDDQFSQHLDDILLTLLVATEEVIACASSKHLSTVLISPPQLLVGWAILKSILLAECVAPEGSMIGVDSIIGGPADQAEGDDVPVNIKMMSDGLVELDGIRTLHGAHCMTKRTSMGSVLNAVCVEDAPRDMLQILYVRSCSIKVENCDGRPV